MKTKILILILGISILGCKKEESQIKQITKTWISGSWKRINNIDTTFYNSGTYEVHYHDGDNVLFFQSTPDFPNGSLYMTQTATAEQEFPFSLETMTIDERGALGGHIEHIIKLSDTKFNLYYSYLTGNDRTNPATVYRISWTGVYVKQ